MSQKEVKSTKYNFDIKLDVESLYKQILKGDSSFELIEKISRNFVDFDRELAYSYSKNLLPNTDSHIFCNERSKSLFSNTPGFVHYSKNKIEIFPLFCINKEKTFLKAIIPFEKFCNRNLTIDLLRRALENLDLYMLVPDEKIDEIIQIHKDKGGLLTLLQGVVPENKIPAIVKLVEKFEKKIGYEDKTGKIDYKNRNHTWNVNQGELIATYTPPVEGTKGKNIYGNPTDYHIAEKDTYIIGEGVSLKGEEQKIYSNRSGILRISLDNSINVTDLEVIEGNVDLTTGDLNVNGDLLVKGDIDNGLVVKAEGSIEVWGNIYKSNISCGRDLIVSGGIIGDEKIKIEISGSVQVNSLRKCNLIAKGDVTVNNFILHCDIATDGCLKMTNSKSGKIVGGKISAYSGIDVNVVGSNGFIRTDLVIGNNLEIDNKEIDNKFKQLRIMEETNNKNIIKFKTVLGKKYFEDPKKYMASLPKRKILAFRKIIKYLKICIAEREKIDQKINLITKIKARQRNSSIIIRQSSHENTYLYIGTESMILKNCSPIRNGVKYVYDKRNKGIKSIPLEKT